MISVFKINNNLSAFVLFFLGVVGFIPVKSYAFKVDTHVWVGQQIINDLEDDGRITIAFGDTDRTFAVDSDIVDAILNNQNTYRMGNIGPDAFPDIFTGQFVVHPGVDTEWKTDDWLRFLLQSENMDPRDLAFVYGYLGHAAADTMAHTYVNHYSGNIFDILGELPNEPSVDSAMTEEFRHFELEKYIASYDPPITDNNGNELGEPVDILSTPALFLRDRLIFNDEVARRNSPHLRLVHELRKNLIDVFEREFRKMDILTVQIIVWYFTDGVIDLDSEQAGKLADLAQKINDFSSENNGIDEVQNAKNELMDTIEAFVELDASLRTQLDESIIAIYQTLAAEIDAVSQQRVQLENEILTINAEQMQVLADLADANQVFETLNSSLNDLNNDLYEKQAELSQALIDISNTASNIAREVCHWSCGGGLIPLCRDICDLVYDPNPVYQALQGLIDSLNNAIAGLNNEIIDVNNQINIQDELVQGLANVANELATTLVDLNTQINDANIQLSDLNGELESALMAKDMAVDAAVNVFLNALHIESDVFNGAVDMAQRLTSDINPLRAFLRGWVGDIEDAMLAYIITSDKVIRATMRVNESALDPLQEWWDCWGPSLFAIPAPISTTACSVRNRIDEIMQAIDDFEYAILELGGPIGREINDFKTKIDEEIRTIQEELIVEFLEAVTDVPIQKILDLLNEPASDARLNDFFGTDQSALGHKGLLEFPDMADRIKAEMHVSNHQYDPEQFSVIYNAVILAKLGLLGAAQLNELAGSDLYDESATTPVNILIGAIRSIDGNHQWMQIAPPYPRRQGFRDGGWPQKRSYGYGQQTGGGENDFLLGDGFLLWTDCDARENVFRQIFRGPLVPGIEIAEDNGFSNVLNFPYYPTSSTEFARSVYPVSLDNPFPAVNSNEIVDDCVNSDPSTNDADFDGLTVLQELIVGTDRFNSDSDGDGMSDGYEVNRGYDPLDPSDSSEDPDGDGLSNFQEYMYGTNPLDPDTDDDLLGDDNEVTEHGTNPLSWDTDNDGMGDNFEVTYGLNANDPSDVNGDLDGDGLSNETEYLIGTNPADTDTDGDGISDRYEYTHNLDPKDANDAIADPDSDGLTNLEEFRKRTDPTNSDTDGDGLLDGEDPLPVGPDWATMLRILGLFDE